MKKLAVIAGIFALGIATISQAAILSWSATAPTVDGSDIANFSGVSADADNIAGGDDQATYVSINRDAVGQTFTTGGNGAGYTLNSITLQDVNYANGGRSVDTGWNGYNAGSFGIQIGTISGTNFSVIVTDSALMDDSAPANGNDGSAYYATITLSSGLFLNANTVYGFAIYSTNDGTTDPFSGPFFETNGDGTTSGNYTEGEAFGLITSGHLATTEVVSRTGDRVFHLDMIVVPEPSSALLVLFGSGSLIFYRRSKQRQKNKQFSRRDFELDDSF